MAGFDFLCIFLCEVVPEGAMVFAPDAPDTVSVEPPAFGLLMPVPPCPPAAPPPPAPCAYAVPEIPISNAEITIPFVETRMVVSSSAKRSLAPEGVSPPMKMRNSHAAQANIILHEHHPLTTAFPETLWRLATPQPHPGFDELVAVCLRATPPRDSQRQAQDLTKDIHDRYALAPDYSLKSRTNSSASTGLVR
jgi:hypothetical protein